MDFIPDQTQRDNGRERTPDERQDKIWEELRREILEEDYDKR